MDRAGIDHGLLLQLFEAPTVRAGLEEAAAQRRAGHGRLHTVTTVDPTRGKEEVRAAIRLWDAVPGLAGIKLYPGYKPFYPHDPRLAPVYEYAHRRGLPILVHQGDTLDGIGLVKYARPIEVDEVAGRYRDVRFVLCHLGNPWVHEAAELAAEPYFTRERLSGTREVVDQAMGRLGVSLRPALELASLQSLKRTIAHGGYTIISALTIEAEQRAGSLVGIPIRGLELGRELQAIRRPGRRRPEAASALWAWLEQRTSAAREVPAPGRSSGTSPGQLR
jgi:hypothetical protein